MKNWAEKTCGACGKIYKPTSASSKRCRLCVPHEAAEGRFHLYGITEPVFMSMVAGQKNKCAICNADFTGKRINVDHCHDTGAVRGLLCTGCNVRLGHVELPGWLDSALSYLDGAKRG